MNKFKLILNLQKLMNTFNLHIKRVKKIEELEELRIQYLGKKGYVIQHIKKILQLPVLDRKDFGKKINDVKKYINDKIHIKKKKINNLKNINDNYIDISLPGRKKHTGSMHPITSTIYYIEYYFSKLGFNILNNGFEVEDQYHNFDALNISKYHPARGIQDTFWFDSNRLLRTQTSNMQIHEIKKNKLPIKIIIPGKVYRKDYDQTHSPVFHQVEGLIIDKNISFANLKWLISNFLNDFFNKDINIRFRSSFFPFTVLSTEVDIISVNNTWLEVLGCGMVHPKILKQFNIDTNIYSGLAFGVGIERMIMLYYGIQDLRLFLKNDLSFLKQFKSSRYY